VVVNLQNFLCSVNNKQSYKKMTNHNSLFFVCSDLIDTAHAFFMVLFLINCGYFELHREVDTDICVLQCLLFCLLSF
jgi:hypothetical protein